MAKLVIVPTPIGNLSDMTYRAVEVLCSADLILAEDTRTSSVLLQKYGIHKPMLSHHKFNEHRTVQSVIERIEAGEEVALISDAGTPGISDPGFMLSRACAEAGIEVDCLPGPCAFVPALVASGLPCDRFVFEGFLPMKKGRQTRLVSLAEETRTVVIYESPYRVLRTLQQLAEHCGLERPAAACRELTKLHQEIKRGSLEELIAHFSETPPRGEFVLVIGGKK
ncbi:rRNA small subunit methyltransferase I [Porphyromonas crevioricanis JCM 15906]|uniref:Ribosomal RNA small subunit methyltransferase I n=2 Tax=Porphyromonas crevioricanis TaxID=393921 RepID=A0A2X4PPV2_9PORP|nr:16S rRNA (cytidine(1402)-2'-O)-methyltransferase [Porphyromonas crevioricanis]KGN95935.1 16S rRNA methyltransferase [Porphyromonas crevioricanis]SJZ71586.1 16S rRNA (cytidine1402-2'-O)-methyltransferase [Porphyromonas crevioricanis]SQH73558.1 Ribosomal RNA small subunit methyltransferase I [Porphyromonas crevioricanis]GAD05555.1 rRNA small subunit methyltransferase I [Porphyromonas crevioricanis JCM 15906]GAD07828.1 rRNA small subunit methyltransferase I [Porphyromonas crevioricanis JCM 139